MRGERYGRAYIHVSSDRCESDEQESYDLDPSRAA